MDRISAGGLFCCIFRVDKYKFLKKGTHYMEGNFRLNQAELLIELPRELDHHNAEEIRRQADRMLHMNYISKIVFDFAKTEFMDSSGIGVIMGRYKHIRFMGGSVGVRNVSPRVKRLLTMAGIYKLVGKEEE